MTDPRDLNIYRNTRVGAGINPVMPDPDAIDEDFAEQANRVLEEAAELARSLVGAHQSAAAIVVQGDWGSVRKVFSLSEKYAAWAGYAAPAKGLGTHAWLLQHRAPVRFTQAELEAHPDWLGFGTEASAHPPMRGWMAAPILDTAGVCWGLMQLSDKYEGDFTAADERAFCKLAALVSTALEALWAVRCARKAATG